MKPARLEDWDNRAHFFAAAAEAMRRILVDRARAQSRLRRGGNGGGRPAKKLTLDIADIASMADEEDPKSLLLLDRAIEALSQRDPRLASTAKLRFYAGLSVEETAEALGVSPRTVKRDWSFARAWLYDHLTRERSGQSQ